MSRRQSPQQQKMKCKAKLVIFLVFHQTIFFPSRKTRAKTYDVDDCNEKMESTTFPAVGSSDDIGSS
jgi:hypothetical protein